MRSRRPWLVVALVVATSVTLATVSWGRHQGPSGAVTVRSAGSGQTDSPGRALVKSATMGPSERAEAAPTAEKDRRLAKAARERKSALTRLAQITERQSRYLRNHPPETTFTMATFNTLGASHTGAGGTHAGKADGHTRGAWAARVLLDNGVDVAALQEFEAPQAAAFVRTAGGTYAVWPGGSSRDGVNSVAWRRDRFDLVRSDQRAYPYFRGKLRNYPLVKLRDRGSGVEFWVTSYHNPASNPHVGNQDRSRHGAVSREIADINALRRMDGAPVLVAGDMNDRAPFFCPFATGTGMHSADGGSGADGCRMPPHPWYVDWILGTPDVSFSQYQPVRDALVQRTSDHPLILVRATVTGVHRR